MDDINISDGINDKKFELSILSDEETAKVINEYISIVKNEKYSLRTIEEKRRIINQICRFLETRKMTKMKIATKTWKELEYELTKWLIKNNYIVYRVEKNTNKRWKQSIFGDLKRIYYLMIGYGDIPEREKDVWNLKRLGINYNSSQVKNEELPVYFK